MEIRHRFCRPLVQAYRTCTDLRRQCGERAHLEILEMGLIICASVDAHNIHLLSPRLEPSKPAIAPLYPGVRIPGAAYHKPMAYTTTVFALAVCPPQTAIGASTAEDWLSSRPTTVYARHHNVAYRFLAEGTVLSKLSSQYAWAWEGAKHDTVEQAWTIAQDGTCHLAPQA